eukprot:TRINITY_DN32538_c0_g1_i1.p2 TRINITY_DN32538_c0_g1~~TRINITY_DN32538_c0_g1_i1.p2  ORF type:complete len:199 (+),score=83.06 TRINITY_DN32538_c0_g1_i1:46-597(+)
MAEVTLVVGAQTRTVSVPPPEPGVTLGQLAAEAAKQCGDFASASTWRCEASEDGALWCEAQPGFSAHGVVCGFGHRQLRFTAPQPMLLQGVIERVSAVDAAWVREAAANVLRFVLPAVVMFFVTVSLFSGEDKASADLSAAVRASAASDGIDATAEKILSALPQENAAQVRRAVAKFLAGAVT